MRCCDRAVVAIYSREDRRTYEWLIRTITFIPWVKGVLPILITNTPSDFKEQVPECSFAILFHSKTRGRLNITDVVDNLYDKELKRLSEVYGRDNVIVVVGDMEDSSNEKKASILREQPKLSQYASDVFLFNEVKDDKAPFEGPKMKDMKNKIRKRASRELCKRSFIWLVFLAVMLLIVIIAVSVRGTKHPEIPSTLTSPVNVTNATFHFISILMTTSPPSTNVTSNTTSSMTTSPPSTNVTSNTTSSMTTPPPSTNATSNTTSSSTFQRMNVTILSANINSTAKAKP